jgi:hypothetical protein
MAEQIRTQSVPPRLAAAIEALFAVLAGEPADPLLRAEVAGAIVQLSDVSPPYPPHPLPLEAIEVGEGLRRFMAELDAAVGEVDAVEGLRIALVGRELRDQLGRYFP